MADHENCVPASIGFGETVLISARIECRGWQVCVLERSHPATTCGISFAGTWFPSEESTTVTGSGVDHCTRNFPSQPVRSGEDAVSCQTAEALHTGLGKNPGRPSMDVCSLESQHQRYHEKSHQPMDRVDCQGSLHTSWSRVWPSYCTWCQSTVSIMDVQLSGGPTWQRRLGSYLGPSRICIYRTWLVSLMACLLWVQWWSHNKLWIQDIFTLLHSLHDLYAATATTFLMEITWFLAGIFKYGME